MEKFWMVYSPEMSAPRVQHDTLEKASSEARRLSYNNPGKRYFVMESMHISIGSVTISFEDVK